MKLFFLKIFSKYFETVHRFDLWDLGYGFISKISNVKTFEKYESVTFFTILDKILKDNCKNQCENYNLVITSSKKKSKKLKLKFKLEDSFLVWHNDKIAFMFKHPISGKRNLIYFSKDFIKSHFPYNLPKNIYFDILCQ